MSVFCFLFRKQRPPQKAELQRSCSRSRRIPGRRRPFSVRTGCIYAECDPRNEASWRLLERLGMAREAHLRQNVYFWTDEQGLPQWKDTYVYALLNPKSGTFR